MPSQQRIYQSAKQPCPHLLHVARVEVELVDLLVCAARHEHVLLVVLGVEHTAEVQLAGVERGDDLARSTAAQQYRSTAVQQIA